MNLLTPTFVYHHPYEVLRLPEAGATSVSNDKADKQTTIGVFNFNDISISAIDQLTVTEITNKIEKLQGISNICLSRMRIWIVLSNFFPNNNIDFNTFQLENLKNSLEESFGLKHIEINCLLLSKFRIRSSDDIINSLRNAINDKIIQYLILLNNNNLSWIHSGNSIIKNDKLFLIYGYKIIEQLHFTNYFLDDLGFTFNNIGSEKFIFTIGSSISPEILINEKTLKNTATEVLSKTFIKQTSILYNEINHCLSQLKPPLIKINADTISDHNYEEVFKKLEGLFYEFSKVKDTEEDEKVKKNTKDTFFDFIYTILDTEQTCKFKPLVNWFAIKYYMILIIELIKNHLIDFLTFLDTDLSDKTILVEKKKVFITLLRNSRIEREVLQYPDEKELESTEYVLKNNLKNVDNLVKEWILDKDLYTVSEEDDTITLFDTLTKKINIKKIGDIFSSKKLDKIDNLLLMSFLAKKAFNESITNMSLKIQNDELRVLLKATRKNIISYKDNANNRIKPINDTEIRTLLSSLSDLKEIIYDKRKFDKKIYNEVVIQKTILLFKEAFSTNSKFNDILSGNIRILIQAHKLSAINIDEGKNKDQLSFNSELYPFFDCSEKLENYNRIKQFLYTNQIIPSNDSGLTEYIKSNSFSKESLSIYGPWTVTECLNDE